MKTIIEAVRADALNVFRDTDNVARDVIEYMSSALEVRAVAPMMTAALCDVIAERTRQVSIEGWTLASDDQHPSGDMALAAACYAAHAGGAHQSNDAPPLWPWDRHWWKPTAPRRDLVKAAALMLAEIERIDRAGDHQ